MVAFCLCPKNLPEAKLKSNGVISLLEAILRQPNVESVAWLSVITLLQVHNEQEQLEQTKEDKLYRL